MKLIIINPVLHRCSTGISAPHPTLSPQAGRGSEAPRVLVHFCRQGVHSLSPFFTGRGWGEGLSRPYDSNFGNAVLGRSTKLRIKRHLINKGFEDNARK